MGRGGGVGEMGGGGSGQSLGEVGKDFCPNFLQPFFENIDRRSCNDGSRELIPIFHNPHRKCLPLFAYATENSAKHDWRRHIAKVTRYCEAVVGNSSDISD